MRKFVCVISGSTFRGLQQHKPSWNVRLASGSMPPTIVWPPWLRGHWSRCLFLTGRPGTLPGTATRASLPCGMSAATAMRAAIAIFPTTASQSEQARKNAIRRRSVLTALAEHHRLSGARMRCKAGRFRACLSCSPRPCSLCRHQYDLYPRSCSHGIPQTCSLGSLLFPYPAIDTKG